LTTVPRGGRPAVPGRPGDLGRAVKVVERVAERIHHAVGQRPGQRRSADRDHAQRRGVQATSLLNVGLQHPLEHHRDDDQRVGAVLGHRAHRLEGVEAAAQDDRRGQRGGQEDVREAPGVKQRGGDDGCLARPQRDGREQRRHRTHRAGRGPVGALGGAGGPGGEDDRPAGHTGRGQRRVDASGDELRQRGVVRAIGVGDEADPAAAGLLDGGGELAVVDQAVGALALHHLCHLRAGKAGVEQHHVHPELGGGRGHLDKAAVITAHDGERPALGQPMAGQATGERVGAPLEVRERENPLVVDDRRGGWEARRAAHDARSHRRPEAVQAHDRPHRAIGTRRTQHPGARERAGDVDAIGESHRHRRHPITRAR
jgi:hypothetical protein